MPKLTVLMPAYNAERTIDRAIASTLVALPRGGAVLVYDDASTDRTPEILEGWARRDLRVRWHRASDNGGVGVALDWLVHHASSPWIARMDADDVCLPWRFQPAWMIAKSLGVDFCFTGALNVDDCLRPIRPTVPWPLGAAAVKYDLVVDNSLFHGAVLARREALFELGGYRDVEAEDYDLWMRAVLEGCTIVRVPWQGYLYRSHQDQVTQSEHHHAALRESEWLAQSHAHLTEVATGRRFEIFPALQTDRNQLSAQQRGEIAALADVLEASLAADPAVRWWDRVFLKTRRIARLRSMAEGAAHA
ncbi:MAG: glycosyltransferase [Kocuria sp.]|nr:glycosyltransferase [Kocuria sp.]